MLGVGWESFEFSKWKCPVSCQVAKGIVFLAELQRVSCNVPGSIGGWL